MNLMNFIYRQEALKRKHEKRIRSRYANMEYVEAGRIIEVGTVESGTSSRGKAWRKQRYTLETSEQYPRFIPFEVWGDKIEELAIQAGEELAVILSVNSNLWQGKRYPQIECYAVRRGNR